MQTFKGVDIFAAPEGAGAGSRTAGRKTFESATVCGVDWLVTCKIQHFRHKIDHL